MAWAPDYCTSDELKAYARIPDTADDAQVALAVTAASRTVDQVCNRQFGVVSAPEARYYTAVWDRDLCRWVIPVDDVMTVAGLLVEFDSVGDGTFADEIDDYGLAPRNAVNTGRPWTELIVNTTSLVRPDGSRDAVQVTGTWGWTSVPDTIKTATMFQANRFLMRRDSPFGVAGSPDQGSELRLLAKVDPDVAVLLSAYTKVWGAV